LQGTPLIYAEDEQDDNSPLYVSLLLLLAIKLYAVVGGTSVNDLPKAALDRLYWQNPD